MDNLNIIVQVATQLIALGAFYGAVKVEIEWIKKTLERLERSHEEQPKRRKR